MSLACGVALGSFKSLADAIVRAAVEVSHPHWLTFRSATTQMIANFCVDHPERYLLAFVYGHLGQHDLLRVRTDAEKFLLLAALNLVECVAYLGAQLQSK